MGDAESDFGASGSCASTASVDHGEGLGNLEVCAMVLACSNSIKGRVRICEQRTHENNDMRMDVPDFETVDSANIC